jgi:hypothetical protein
MLPMRTTPPFRADHVGSLLQQNVGIFKLIQLEP